MPQPTRSDVHVNKPLTNMSIAYIQKAEDFIADKVFPLLPVMKQSDRYFVYTKDYWFRTAAQKRAPSSESAGSGFKVDNTPSYFCDVWAVHQDIDDQTRQNADDPLNMDRDATLFVTQQQLLRREIQFMGQYMKAGIWSSDFVPQVLWSSDTSNPIQDVDNQKTAIKQKTGFMPNVFVVSTDVFFRLRNHPVILDRIKYTQRGVISEDLLATLFGVEKFLVASAVLNSAQEGAAGSFDYLMKDSALLVYANKAPSILQPSGGYIFAWQGLYGAGAAGGRISSFRMEHLKSDRIEGEMSFDMKLVGADLGVFFNGVL